jgi:hypothetical protein
MTMCKSLIVSGAVIGFISCVPSSANAEPRASLNIADHDGIYVDGRSFKVIPGTASGDGSALMRKSGVRELGPAAIVFRKGDKLYLATVPPSQQSFGSDRRDYGSDRDESPSTAQSEREWREWQQGLRQNNNRRDYGSDRDENPSTAQSEREWREWQQSLRQNNNRYGSDRDENPSTAQSEREWRESQLSLRQNNNRYGSDRDENPSTAQSEREWREWQQSLRQNNNRRDYGSDRYAGALDQQRLYVNDPDYAEYRLRKLFDENWTAGDTK